MVDGLVPLFLPSSAICVTVAAKTGVIMLDAGLLVQVQSGSEKTYLFITTIWKN